MKQKTAMKQLIEQILDEMKLDHIPKEWVSCMKGVIMAIEHTYLEKEKQQIADAYDHHMLVKHLDARDYYHGKQYYYETYVHTS